MFTYMTLYDIFFTYIYPKNRANVSGYTITVVDLMVKILYSKILPQLEALRLLAARTHSRKWCWCTIHGDSGGSSVGTCFFSTLWTRNQNSEVPKRTCKLRNEQESGIFGIRRFTETNAGSIRVFFVHNLVQLKFLSNTGNLGSVSMLKHCLWVWYLEHFWRDWDKKNTGWFIFGPAYSSRRIGEWIILWERGMEI